MDAKIRQAAIEARKRYYKQWRMNNADKVRANNERYWVRRAEREAQAAMQTTEGGKDHAADATVSENS